MCRKWNEMGYEHLQMHVFVENLSDRVAKAERGSKTLRDDMKEQHMLSEIAENSNPIQESESGRENANESTAIEGERNLTLQIKSPSPQESKTERCLEQQGYQRRKNTMDNQKFF